MTLNLCAILDVIAERRRDYPLHGDSLDYVARAVISRAVPPGATLPLPHRSEDEPERQAARDAWLQVYHQLCEKA